MDEYEVKSLKSVEIFRLNVAQRSKELLLEIPLDRVETMPSIKAVGNDGNSVVYSNDGTMTYHNFATHAAHAFAGRNVSNISSVLMSASHTSMMLSGGDLFDFTGMLLTDDGTLSSVSQPLNLSGDGTGALDAAGHWTSIRQEDRKSILASGDLRGTALAGDVVISSQALDVTGSQWNQTSGLSADGNTIMALEEVKSADDTPDDIAAESETDDIMANYKSHYVLSIWRRQKDGWSHFEVLQSKSLVRATLSADGNYIGVLGAAGDIVLYSLGPTSAERLERFPARARRGEKWI